MAPLVPHPQLRASAAHVFVADLDRPDLEDPDRHHLDKVLRLRPGEAVTASDGRGRWRSCTWVGGGLEPAGETEEEPAPHPLVAVGFAVTKGDKPEWAVQKLTEVGVDRIVPFVSDRSVVRWSAERADHHLGRWRRVAREAAMQSRRARLPVVEGLVTFSEVVATTLPEALLADPGGSALTLDHPEVLVGPEGGWSPEELQLARGTVGLGSTVLRSETAAVAAGVLLTALRSGLLRPGPGQ
jgi:16S rRNA (uracil1498-N3)-methyltransferase